MPKYIIEGGKKLVGELELQGAKNSALPILAASLLVCGDVVLHNCPNLSDVRAALKILNSLGCKTRQQGNDIFINSSTVTCSDVPCELMREMRSSVVFLGAILSRCSKASVTAPGGCELGPRPIDLHLGAMKELGFSVEETCGRICCQRVSNPKFISIHLDFPSVGATENVILASCVSKSRVVLRNAAREPEIIDLANFLNNAGAKIMGAGTDMIEIVGVDTLYSTEHTVIPDRIAAATYMSAAAICGGEFILKNVNISHLCAILRAFDKMGCDIKTQGDSLKLLAGKPLKRIDTVRSSVYPGFPTDAGPLLIASLIKAEGTSVFTENIFENRFNYIGELKRLGADVKVFGKAAIVQGVKRLQGAHLSCTDLRGGAAMVIAALGADGVSTVDKICHIERGYENFELCLKQLSLNIKKE